MIAGCDPPDLSGVSPIRIGSLASALWRRLLVSSVIPAAHRQARPTLKKTVCGVCGQIHRGVYDRTVRRVRDLPCGGMRIFVEIELRRVACRRCGAVKRERLDWLADNPRYTKRFTFYVRRRCREHRRHCRGAAPGVAHGQGARDAVHAPSSCGALAGPRRKSSALTRCRSGKGTAIGLLLATSCVAGRSGSVARTARRRAWMSSSCGWEPRTARGSGWW